MWACMNGRGWDYEVGDNDQLNWRNGSTAGVWRGNLHTRSFVRSFVGFLFLAFFGHIWLIRLIMTMGFRTVAAFWSVRLHRGVKITGNFANFYDRALEYLHDKTMSWCFPNSIWISDSCKKRENKNGIVTQKNIYSEFYMIFIEDLCRLCKVYPRKNLTPPPPAPFSEKDKICWKSIRLTRRTIQVKLTL